MDNFEKDLPGSQSDIPQEEELTHTDKLAGVLSEPKNTFEKTAKFPLKTIDWLLPVLVLLIISGITSIITLSNPEIKYTIQQQQAEAIDKMVKEGQLSEEQAEQQKSMMGGGMMYFFSVIGIFIWGFVSFFFMSGIYMFFSKVVLKGSGTYTSSMVANGLTAYIDVINVIISAIIVLLTGKLMVDFSAATLFEVDRFSLSGWFLTLLNPVTIWAHIVLAIGLGKLFKAESLRKYYIVVFSVWIIGGLIMFFLTKNIPIPGISR